MHVIILDARMPFNCSRVAASALALPYGETTFVEHVAQLVRRATSAGAGEFWVVSGDAEDDAYAAGLAAATSARLRVLSPAALVDELDGCTRDDDLLILDATCWPVGDFDIEDEIRAYLRQRLPTYLVATGAEDDRARERVERDHSGQVKRVQRVYRKQALPGDRPNNVFLAMVPAAAARGIPLDSGHALRTGLVKAGHRCRDVPQEIDVADLSESSGVLAVNEYRLLQNSRPLSRTNGNSRRQLRCGAECAVDPGARIVGPVTLHDRVVVEAGATLVGPTVVGSGATISAGAIVAQSVIAPGTLVREEVTVRHCVAGGTCQACATCTMPTESAQLAAGTGDRLRESGPMTKLPQPVGRRVQFAIKRLVDVVAAATGLLVLSPLLILVTVLVKVTSPGPVFFCHGREQRGGREFACLKFRTMCDNAHMMQAELALQNEVDGPQFKLRHDPRVTRLGAWLRTTNIDELPQLFNVLLGHMSLVGPRPSPFRENQICVPWRRARLSVRPGITGLWQICRSADRSAGDFHEWIFYDITYVRRFSLWLDLKILVATALTLGGRSSVPVSRLVDVEVEVPERPAAPVGAAS